ncbi:MAG: serine hydrolase domain-containing protein [Chitinophagales bacterium]
MKKIASILFILLSIRVGFTQNSTNLALKKIDSIVLAKMLEHDMVGVSLGIVNEGKIYLLKGYGTREIYTDKPIDSLTNFLTCSISKLFTATAIMQLVEQGKIETRKKLIEYVPEFTMTDKRYRDITIEQMLTHTSGLPNVFKKNFINPENDSIALTLFAKKLNHKKLSFQPGVQLSAETYSNTAYNLLGLVIERVSGKTYIDYITENVLLPAGLKNSSFFYQTIDENRRSLPHKKVALTGEVKVSGYYPDIPQDKPCGNLNSCSLDMCNWIVYNLAIYNSAPSDGGVIISKNTLQSMWNTTHDIPPYKTSIGLGWWILDSDKYGKLVFHDGNDPGFSSSLIISPENNFGVVILCNGMYPMEIIWNELPFEIMDIFAVDWNK